VRRRHFFHLREGKFMRMTQRPIRCFSLLAIVMLALPALGFLDDAGRAFLSAQIK